MLPKNLVLLPYHIAITVATKHGAVACAALTLQPAQLPQNFVLLSALLLPYSQHSCHKSWCCCLRCSNPMIKPRPWCCWLCLALTFLCSQHPMKCCCWCRCHDLWCCWLICSSSCTEISGHHVFTKLHVYHISAHIIILIFSVIFCRRYSETENIRIILFSLAEVILYILKQMHNFWKIMNVRFFKLDKRRYFII